MKVSTEDIRTAMDSIARYLIENELAIDMNPSVVLAQKKQRSLVTWSSAGISTAFTNQVFGSFSEYLQLVKDRQFSVVLKDGALLQMSYTVEPNGEIYDHRLCWYPCPAPFDLDVLMEGMALDEIVESTPLNLLYCKGPIRFDYSPRQQEKGHPASHIHFFSDNSRVPVRGPLSIATFARFVLKHFYSSDFETVEKQPTFDSWHEPIRMETEEYYEPHLYWRTGQP